MRIRNQSTLRTIGRVAAPFVSLAAHTLRVELDDRGQLTNPWDPNLKERYVYSLWHESQLGMMALRCAVPRKVLKQSAPSAAIVSGSEDGSLAAALWEAFGIHIVRGSSNRGGYEAADEVLTTFANMHLTITPDGPTGPRRKVKRGVAYLASWMGKAVVPLGLGFSHAYRLKTWDRLAIPYLFSTVKIIAGPILRIPSQINKRQSEEYRQELETRMDETQREAAQWAGEKIDEYDDQAEQSPAARAA